MPDRYHPRASLRQNGPGYALTLRHFAAYLFGFPLLAAAAQANVTPSFDTFTVINCTGTFVGNGASPVTCSRVSPDGTVSPTLFGAKCDGVNDDRAAIQSAGDYAVSVNAALRIPESSRGCAIGPAPGESYSLSWSRPIEIVGREGASILKPLSTISASTDIIHLYGSAITYRPVLIDGLFIGDVSSGLRYGRNGIVFDTQLAGQQFPRPIVRHTRIQDTASGGYSIFTINNQSNNPAGGFTLGRIEDSELGSGASFNFAGDSILLDHVVFGGSAAGGTAALYSNLVNGTGGGAGNLVLRHVNCCGPSGGIVVDCGNFVLDESEVEQSSASTEPNNALVDLRGAVCPLRTPVIHGNLLQSDAGVGNPTLLRIANVSGALVDKNSFATPADYPAIVVTPAAVNATVTPANAFSGMTTRISSASGSTQIGTPTTLSGGSGAASFAAGTTYYVAGGVSSTNEPTATFVAPRSGVIRNLHAYASNGAPGAGQSYAVTVRKALADTALACVISGASLNVCNNAADAVTVTAGQNLDFKIVSSAGAAASSGWALSLEFDIAPQ